MTNLDPTTLPEINSLVFNVDAVYTVEEVAHLQSSAINSASNNLNEIVSVEFELLNHDKVNIATNIAANLISAPGNNMGMLSGRYLGVSEEGGLQIELRIDIDGKRPMRKISGDFFRSTGDTIIYIGSFIISDPSLSVNPSIVKVKGNGKFTFDAGSPEVVVTIQRVNEVISSAIVEIQFMTTKGAKGVKYDCNFQSAFFRQVAFELDFVKSVQPFRSYDTSLLSSNGPLRTLTVTSAFGEAGIEMVDTGLSNEIPLESAGEDNIWTNRELHAAMQDHFELWANEPGWKVWFLSATKHALGTNLRGIMFDRKGQQRQGCAVFHDVIGGNTNEIMRAQLHTYVHELGHCFNLCHSHEKETMHPPQPNRYDALSWMNYPEFYRSVTESGAEAFWHNFPFQFDDLEIIHLRHAYRNEIIMGGDDFIGSISGANSLSFANPIEDKTGLRLKISSPASYCYGEPVVVEFKLELAGVPEKRVNIHLHPNYGYTQLGICKQGGKTRVYKPFLQHCVEPDINRLYAQAPAVYESAYIGYGKEGHYFDGPGLYQLRAVYQAMEGSLVYSNQITIRIISPVGKKDNEIGNLFLDEEQGKLLYLLGSDAESLQGGNDAFNQVIAQFKDHPMAMYAKLIIGMNKAQSFKTIDAKRKKVNVRSADLEESVSLLSGVFKCTTRPGSKRGIKKGLDNISFNMAARSLVSIQMNQGNIEQANSTAHETLAYFSRPEKGIPAFVLKKIRQEIFSILDKQ